MLNRRKLLDLNTEISGYDTAQLVYNVTSGTSTRLFGADFTLSNIEKMTIDGIPVNPVSEYEFDTSGEHNVAVKMVHNPGTRFKNMFNNCTDLVYIDLSQLDMSEENSLEAMFYCASNISDFTSIKDWDVSNVETMSYLFSECSITSCNMCSNWSINKAQDLIEMFAGCSNLTTTEGLNIKSAINYMSGMFARCINLTNISSLTNLSFDVGAGVLSDCFSGCIKLDNIDVLSTWATLNVINMGGMFYNCKYLTSLEALRNWYVDNVRSFDNMFNNCISLTSIEPIQSWNTICAKNFRDMFFNCMGITSMDLSNWNVSQAQYLEGMFSQCLLRTLNVTGWDTSNVKTMQGMFSGCNYLYEISGIENFNTRNVTNFNTMFASCWSLRNLPELVYNFDTSSAITINSMFNKCRWLDGLGIGMLDEEKLVDLDLSNWDLSNCTSMVSFLCDCRDLRSLTIRGSLKSTVNLTGMFTYLGSGTRPSGTFYYDTDSTYELIKTVLPAEWSAIKI